MTAVARDLDVAPPAPANACSPIERLRGELEMLRLTVPPRLYLRIRARAEHALTLIQEFTTSSAADERGEDSSIRTGPATWSTPGNELAFLCSRIATIQNIIAEELHASGCRVPEGFGSMELQPIQARTSSPPALALWRLLDELEAVVGGLTIDVYCARFDDNVSGSIGEHVRHCLDHIAALLAADEARATLSYDRRERGTAVERHPDDALRRIDALKRGCVAWSSRSLDAPIRVSSVISSRGESVAGWSTLGRELAFVVSHTIHHQALIGVLLAIHGQEIPDRFGHSPSTPRRH